MSDPAARQTMDAIGVVGAGFMGSGIAECAARAGLVVHLYEPEREALERSGQRIAASVRRAIARGQLSDDQATALHERVRPTTSLDDLSEASLVIEAAPEDPQIKGRLFQQLDRRLPDATLLASNTSSIPIAQIASWTSRPERVLGLHFFSPVPVMRLVEVVTALETSPDAAATAEALVARLGKQPIRTKDRSGFIVNMLLVPYLMAAVRMYDEGFATREDIDAGMRLGCGHPMGPLALCDFIGLDVLYAVCESLYDEFKRPEYAPPPLLRRMVVAGRHGRKSGSGFYAYAEEVAA
jgi:3-hydroxybutyryl-CoA dehydrogenase